LSSRNSNTTFLLLLLSGKLIRPFLLFVGVKSFDVSLDSQTALVKTEPTVSYETVLATIKKTGKTVNSGEADGIPMNV
jgi:copper chaperone